jgi:hypothetical protein
MLMLSCRGRSEVDISMDFSGTVVLLDRATLEILLLLLLMFVRNWAAAAPCRVPPVPPVILPVVWLGGGRLSLI